MLTVKSSNSYGQSIRPSILQSSDIPRVKAKETEVVVQLFLHFLDLSSLRSCAPVCKLWHGAVKKVESYRIFFILNIAPRRVPFVDQGPKIGQKLFQAASPYIKIRPCDYYYRGPGKAPHKYVIIHGECHRTFSCRTEPKYERYCTLYGHDDGDFVERQFRCTRDEPLAMYGELIFFRSIVPEWTELLIIFNSQTYKEKMRFQINSCLPKDEIRARDLKGDHFGIRAVFPFSETTFMTLSKDLHLAKWKIEGTAVNCIQHSKFRVVYDDKIPVDQRIVENEIDPCDFQQMGKWVFCLLSKKTRYVAYFNERDFNFQVHVSYPNPIECLSSNLTHLFIYSRDECYAFLVQADKAPCYAWTHRATLCRDFFNLPASDLISNNWIGFISSTQHWDKRKMTLLNIHTGNLQFEFVFDADNRYEIRDHLLFERRYGRVSLFHISLKRWADYHSSLEGPLFCSAKTEDRYIHNVTFSNEELVVHRGNALHFHSIKPQPKKQSSCTIM